MGRNRVLDGLPWEGRSRWMLRCCEMSECQYRCTSRHEEYRRFKDTVGCYSIRIPTTLVAGLQYSGSTPKKGRRTPAGPAQETCRL